MAVSLFMQAHRQDPALFASQGALPREELGPHPLACQDLEDRLGIGAVANDLPAASQLSRRVILHACERHGPTHHRAAGSCCDAAGCELGAHAARAPLRPARARVHREPTDVLHFVNRRGIGVVLWVGRVQAVDVREQKEPLCVDQCCHVR